MLAWKNKCLYGREDKGEDPSQDTSPSQHLDAPEPAALNSGDNQVELERIEAETWTPYDPGKREMDLSKSKVTNWIQNSHVYLPKSVEQGIEAEIRVRKDTFSETFEQYKHLNCTGEGK